jgi:hypothetical protein
MATQTKTQRQASGHKATATRRANATKRSANATKSSARQTRASARATVDTSAKATATNAKRTGRQATRTAGHGVSVATQRVEELGRRAQRVFRIQVGAAATIGDSANSMRDSVVKTLRTYTTRDKSNLDRLERRGAKALRGPERAITRARRSR